ncbi:small ribosomal subunit protein mS45 [Diutina catenulata]
MLRNHAQGLQRQSVRFRRTLAYPRYPAQHTVEKTHPKKDHSSTFARALKGWLGPKNIRGEYYRNRYYYPLQEHKSNYIVVDGQTVVDSTYQPRHIANHTQPFPLNPACKTALMLPRELKTKIIREIKENGLHHQEAAHKYGVFMQRVEAVTRLQEIEDDLRAKGKISADMDKFDDVMYRMFPLYHPPTNADNLTEIPTPHKTLAQRFLTIAESEPFGPVDAAKLLDLPVAQDTLHKLTDLDPEEQAAARPHTEKTVVVGKEKEGDRTQFKFTKGSIGNVGFRYGASRRDKKKDRAIGFDAEGKMVYL